MVEGGSRMTVRAGDRRPRRRGAVDGLIVGGRDVWVVVATSREDVADLLREGPSEPGDAPLRVCRAILEGGLLVLGASEPGRDPLVSDLMRTDDPDRG